MKYWVYLNDGVSQKSYTEEELQKLNGFGLDTLVCSEVSAVSQEPDWKPAKEFFPYLVRPKAPDFSKFRPKPPMPAAQNNSDNLPLPDTLPAGVSAMPINNQQPVYESQPQDANADLLAQIKSLTNKIASLEGKISEQEKELSLSNSIPQSDEELEDAGKTFVSEPQNEQEDDVLEVPFENDFEVPFDTNKSSEEIAKEAEALLAKPIATEIEEFNTDDQNTELLDYASDMQKILEDTIRKSHLQKPNEKKDKSKDTNKKIRTFIAEDLISNQTLSFSDKEEPEKEEAKPAEQKPVEEEEDEMSAPKNTSFEDHSEEQNQDNQQVVQETTNKGEIKSLDELLQETTPEDSTDNIEQHSQAKENIPEVKTEESTEEETPAKAQLASIEAVPEVKTEESTEEETLAKAQLASIEAVPEVNTEESAQEEAPAKAQLASIEAVPEVKTEESTEEEAQEEIQLSSLDNVPEINIEKPEKQQSELTSENEVPEVNAEEDSVELTPEELTPNNLDSKDEYLKTVSLDEMDLDSQTGMTQQLKVSEVPEEEHKEDNQQDEPVKEEPIADVPAQKELKPLEDNISGISSGTDKVEIPNQLDEDTPVERTANLSMTQGVSISEDDTTAAVLDEIAQEKAQTSTAESTASQLFKELENTYRNETENIEVPLPNDVESANKSDAKPEEDLDQKFAKEDEFLKTFTTSVEEVFLDQPTAIISDYVPPTATSEDVSEHSRPSLSDNSIKREKPSDIKTVPLVPEAMGQEIWSSPYVESATAKLGKTSVLANLGKWIFVIATITIMLAGALSALAVMGIIPEKLSPIHTVIYSLQKTPQDNNTTTDEDLAPEIMADMETAEEVQPAKDNTAVVVDKVKNYMLSSGSSLESKVQAAHPNLSGNVEWSAYPTEEQNIYSIAVRIPQNAEGQGFSYRFNYNLADNILTPTTSGAKNLMDNY